MSFFTEFKPEIKTLGVVLVLTALVIVAGIFAYFLSIPRVTTLGDDVFPAPGPQIEEPRPIDTSIWQVYSNEELGFEVRYPAGWTVTEGTNTVSDKFSDPLLSLHSGNNLEMEVYHGLGGEFWEGGCSQATNEYEILRDDFLHKGVCIEDFQIFLYDWDKNAAKLGLNKRFLDQILSTFRFVEGKPAIPVTDELLEKMKGKLLQSDFSKIITRHYLKRADLDGDGIEEVIVTWFPSEDSLPEFGIFHIVDSEGNYRKIADFDFATLEGETEISLPVIYYSAPVVNLAEDINNDGLIEIHLGWDIGAARPTSDDILLAFDTKKQTLFRMRMIDNEGEEKPAHFLNGRGTNSGGFWFIGLGVANIDGDEELEIAHVSETGPYVYTSEGFVVENWNADVYDWDGSIYRYSETLSGSGEGSLPQKWVNLKMIGFIQ